MNIYIDGISIPYKKASEVYNIKSTCKRLFGINSRQYEKLKQIMTNRSTFPVSSFENHHQPYSPLESDHRVLPESYSPVTSTSQLAQQFDDTERHIQQQMPMHKPEWYSGSNDNMVNKGLFERRFFAGGPAPTSNPIPVRFMSASTSTSASAATSTATSSSLTQSSGPIFSRTFDLTMQSMPDVTFERQTRNTR